MLSAVWSGITASRWTLQNSAIFSRSDSGTGKSERATITSGWMPNARSSRTECCVGLVFSSCVEPMYGSSVTWMESVSSFGAV